MRGLGIQVRRSVGRSARGATECQINATEFAIYQDDLKNIIDLYPGLLPFLLEELRRYPSAKDFQIFAPISDHL